jgi:hypothetical protein
VGSQLEAIGQHVRVMIATRALSGFPLAVVCTV